ncbi:MAG: hypothetical protein A3H98_00130 [Bacteroidetes bacterium RIFCSPLOWO2_02_FULL_36_8]|nr:MAG: hypothetical protein A3H98_00130 [Bacteroidetes bacterium RIFCSPLOWO2_02_FULL_36_8]OFY70852.1 MAG: hypothetical protein A3G23_12075 [Bacteroidetes bacterium RIFCSPLOWO2_12_FULL_37_12]
MSFKKSHIYYLISFLAIAFILYNTYRFASGLGLQEGYQPEQPIAFSHKTHAGVYKINCVYCHNGVEKSKHALIPDVQTCMNCHAGIRKGEKFGKMEISKILDAYKEGKPLAWVKIHNLPDHVYFNHAQHVKVGKVDCQSCHGKVEEMEQIKQVNTLSMGWCIDCHRKSEVDFGGNDYYDDFKKLHDDFKSGKKEKVFVSDIGGIDCQKCHY